MSKNLKKFVNPSFIKTIDLPTLGRLLDRHSDGIRGLDPAILEGDQATARRALQTFFAGPEEAYSEGLIADLHRVAELGTRNGLHILIQRARAQGARLVPEGEAETDALHLNPKHVALRAFLDYPEVFDAASDILALEARQSLGEFCGAEEGIEANLTEPAQAAFQAEMAKLLKADLMGSYCRLGWYGDEDEINIVMTHGTIVTTTEVIREGKEEVISYRGAEHSVVSYQAETGRLKIGGVGKALRLDVAGIFARTMLGRPDLFADADSQNLYTLEPVERQGFGFRFDCRFDPAIRYATIVEAQVEKTTPVGGASPAMGPWTVTVRDRWNALTRLGELTRNVAFGADKYRLGHIVMRLGFDEGAPRPAPVTIKLKPPSTLMFRRHRHESRVLDLLRRNGLCRDRKPVASAAAAE